MRSARRAGVLLLLVLAAVLAGALPALAHAALVSTSPADGAVLTKAPAQVTLRFDEGVNAQAGSIKVYSPDGRRVDAGTVPHGTDGGATVTARLRGGLGHGTYIAGWRVVSDDSHPVSGAFAFSIGARSRTSAAAAAASTRGSTAVGLAFGTARWAGYAAFALLAGGIVFVVFCWPGGLAVPRSRRLVYGGWAALAAATAAALLLQGPYGAGLGISSALSWRLIHGTLGTRFGWAAAARLMLLGLAQFHLAWVQARLRAAGRGERAALRACTVLLVAALAVTWAVSGHASVGIQVPVAVASDTVHLLAMAAWLGGLAMLAGVTLRTGRRAAPRGSVVLAGDRAGAAARFSPLALGCVAALGGTGFYQAWRQAGTLPALAATGYGRLLLIKTACFAVLIALAALSRRFLSGRVLYVRAIPAAAAPAAAELAPVAAAVGAAARGPAQGLVGSRPPRAVNGRQGADASRTPGRGGGRQGPAAPLPPGHRVDLARLRRSVLMETVVAAGVLAATAILVNSAPPRTATGTARSPAAVAQPAQAHHHAHSHITLQTHRARFGTGGPAGPGTVTAIITHSPSGVNGLYISVQAGSGRPLGVGSLTVVCTQPGSGRRPVPVSVVRAGTGNFIANPLVLPRRGTWHLSLTIRPPHAQHAATVAFAVGIS